MRRRQILYAAMGQGLAAAGPAHGATPAALTWRRRDWLGFGTTLSLRAGGHDEALLERALDASVQAVRTIEAQMSLHAPGSALSRLNREGRHRNVKGAFRLRSGPASVEGRRVVLVDDVLTTGAILAECARVLTRAGAARVDVLTLARVVKEG